MPRRIYLMLAAVLAGVAPWLHAQDQKAEIQKRLTSEFTLTKPTADKSDIATCGRGSGSAQEWIAHVQRLQSNPAPEYLQEGKDNSKRLWEKLLAGFWKHDGDSGFSPST